jgi:hypothetical protein
MKRILALAVAICLSPVPARADELRDSALCQQLTAHVPDPGIAYDPNAVELDPNGDPLPPADLTRPDRLGLDEGGLAVPVTVDLGSRLGLSSDIGTPGAEVMVGTLSLYGGGLYFNGRPLSDSETRQVLMECDGQILPAPQDNH